MEAEQILALMDSWWFERRIIFRNKDEFPSPAAESTHQKTASRRQHLGIRSYSDRCCIGVGFEADSPTSVIIKPKLQKIPSGREIKRERGMNISRSLSALEFEELKGFMDLGFVFNEEEEKNWELVSIVPGLQKWRRADQVEKKARVSRPYLSEAWGDMCRRGGDAKNFMNWKIPIPSLKNDIHMKDHLKNWAHVVASTVR
ncbi:uncharacterized protein LOC131008408 [Salvia miltiorrhiza]|uniref:uncharacterized protein LOC131008408 n=1 Tax=Salvia miltiorrhiza TaxID=226208 RepID=UPI0025AC6C20|nr:uncharacterized protein LOC131008408 [Salvia miltiorrhiza]